MFGFRRWSRPLIVLAVGLTISVWSGPAVLARDCWRPPVDGAVVDPFRAPACRWCAGNRGIEYRVAPGSPVRAVAGGEVTFAGRVASRLYVVVRHADGRRATYGLLADRTVSRGQRVVRNQLVGSTSEAFHFGLRHDDEYVDPAPFLGELRGRPRLVPVDGSAARRVPPPVLRCPAPAAVTPTGSGRDLTVGAVAGAR